ncbi:LytR/AlgR family response regulator transcription factor [Parapedobacter deserti]|uniref:LytR/AlgR family response regulator transcription factor n=1 Tax=Parapedobacter deserti TaxID=1912957 RepID=A0ABV7JEK6_9SPHI
MNIVIIEDEKLTAKDLEDVILEVAPSSNIVAALHSVKQGIDYFRQHPFPDLIFSDIQLGDGLSFDIFHAVEISTPIVFCTAYDEYALQAFRLNGVDYVLKPFTPEAVKAALDKYNGLSNAFSGSGNAILEIQRLLDEMKPAKSSSILVNHKEKIIPVKVDDIAVFYIENQVTYLTNFAGKTYFLNKTLDQIEQMCGKKFFRANRQFLINRDAVGDASHHLSRKFSVRLTIPFEHSITISKEKLSEFLAWLAQ